MSNIVMIIKQAAIEAVENTKPCNLLYGTVETDAPLSIRIDQRLLLTEEFLTLSRNVTDFQTQISFDNPEIKNQIQIGNRPYAPDGSLITKPDTGEEYETAAIFFGKFSFKEKIKHEITVYNALKTGEKVLLARVAGGQEYIVLDRVV